MYLQGIARVFAVSAILSAYFLPTRPNERVSQFGREMSPPFRRPSLSLLCALVADATSRLFALSSFKLPVTELRNFRPVQLGNPEFRFKKANLRLETLNM